AYNVPRITLASRFIGEQHCTSRPQATTAINFRIEFIATWLLEEYLRGYPPLIARAREMATRFP
ncbi:hypothetical protein K432DRAFT_314269, partial [Lepidopterella palustris CBS 459.81]